MSKSDLNYKYYNKLALLFIICLMLANIGATKICNIFGFILPGGIVVFPMLYVLNDILTEVYGFRNSRKVIWLALFCNLFSTLILFSISLLPPATEWSNQEAFSNIFSLAPRIFVASLSSYFVGELLNSFVISELKIRLSGKFFPLRAILSTTIGAFVETLIFASIAFGHHLNFAQLTNIVLTLTFAKVLYEFLLLPISVKLASFLKKSENIDIYEKPSLKAVFNL